MCSYELLIICKYYQKNVIKVHYHQIPSKLIYYLSISFDRPVQDIFSFDNEYIIRKGYKCGF